MSARRVVTTRRPVTRYDIPGTGSYRKTHESQTYGLQMLSEARLFEGHAVQVATPDRYMRRIAIRRNKILNLIPWLLDEVGGPTIRLRSDVRKKTERFCRAR